MAGISYDGIEVPYTSVSADFSRNPAEFIYTSTPRYFGGARITGIRLNYVNDSISVKIDRSGSNKSWDQVKSEINAVLFMHNQFKPLAFNFEGEDGNKFYLARIISIRYSDERKYTANAEIKFICEFPYRFGNEKTINVTTANTSHTILGQIKPHWKIQVNFPSNVESYEFEANGDIIKLTYPFKASDILEIDFINRSIMLNGEDKAVALNLETVWPKIEPGKSTFRASQASSFIYNELYY